jgi:hypothetical protein
VLALGVAVVGLVAAATLVEWHEPLPPIGPRVEQVCVDTMQRSAPDRSWVAPDRDERLRSREVATVAIGDLPFHRGDLVRVAGVLHVEHEWVGLYPSRSAMDDGWIAPWVSFRSLWPSGAYLWNLGPSISDRCVVVEGTYVGGAGGHFGLFNGTIQNVSRLDVWSTPHRPFVMTPPPPQPPRHRGTACYEQPTRPEKLVDPAPGAKMAVEFETFYATGRFTSGYCIATLDIDEHGTVGTVRVLRPPGLDRRVEAAVVRMIASTRYKPATLCGGPVPITTTVGIAHCPSTPRE